MCVYIYTTGGVAIKYEHSFPEAARQSVAAKGHGSQAPERERERNMDDFDPTPPPSPPSSYCFY